MYVCGLIMNFDDIMRLKVEIKQRGSNGNHVGLVKGKIDAKYVKRTKLNLKW